MTIPLRDIGCRRALKGFLRVKTQAVIRFMSLTSWRLNEAQLAVFTRANEIADEFVTPMRLQHVLDAFPGVGMEKT